MIIKGIFPFPFITKEGSLGSFKTISTSEFNNDFNYGDVIKGSFYSLSAPISSQFYTEGLLFDGERKKYLLALKNTLNYYTYLSPHYAFSSSLGDKELQQLKIINIPSIYYGETIRKRTVSCKWFFTGSLMAELQDINGDGELIQTGPPGSLGSGSVAGVVLYKEGFIILTGSWDIHPTNVDNLNIYDPDSAYPPSWKYFMVSGSDAEATYGISSSFGLDFEGTNTIPVMTMFAKAEKGELNHSNNPTYVEYGQKMNPFTGSNGFVEKPDLEIKNIVDAIYDEEEPPFEKITYISKVAIYDEDQNLIGVAKLAKPARKKENDNITFKLKLDI